MTSECWSFIIFPVFVLKCSYKSNLRYEGLFWHKVWEDSSSRQVTGAWSICWCWTWSQKEENDQLVSFFLSTLGFKTKECSPLLAISTFNNLINIIPHRMSTGQLHNPCLACLIACSRAFSAISSKQPTPFTELCSLLLIENYVGSINVYSSISLK